MITIDLGGLLAAFIAAMGIPGAVMGVIVWKLERRIVRQEETINERERSREELLLLVVQSTGAAIALGEATAKVADQASGTHCKEDIRSALEYAMEVKRKQKDFLSQQGIRALWDD